ncbi:MAG: right-handed parallel beta-helix repeat-containing protein [Ruminococcaceae bacterium]|nr:right-handed parallel beta-helix repeat-containing protein [Oscillospiraceae bacterium]
MKRIIALVLVLCMALGMVVSVSAAPSAHFSRTLKLVRLIRTMFDKDEDEGPAIGQLDNGILKVYVAATGKKDADGTAKNPFDTLTAARDAIRDLDKSDFDGIDVVVKKGTYSINEAFVLTEEDSGTKNCPIRYIGEDGVTIVGGVSFTAADFAPATGDDVKYFPEADKIVMIDLKQFGYTAEDMAKYLAAAGYFKAVPFLSADAVRQTLCRYPNYEWINIDDAWLVDSFGNETPYTDNDSHIAKEYQAHTIVVEYGDDHFDRVMSWKSEGHKYISGRLRYLWCHDDTEIINIDTEKDQITVKYVGAYDPVPGTVMYFYNIPEELDVPGEYYISEDAVLYYYPGENFETAIFSFPVVDNIVKIEGADYITLENLVMTSSEGDGINFRDSDYLTIKDCSVSSIKNEGIDGEGLFLTITGNHVYDTGDNGINISSGNLNNPEDYKNETVIRNNYVHDWSETSVIAYSITVDGINITVSHNTTGNSNSKAIHASTGANITIEYNYVFNVLQAVEDCGAISGDGGKGNGNMVYRYNYVHNVGPTAILETIREKNPDFSNVGSVGFYYDGASSYFNTYGNVIANIDGHGWLSNAGRHNYFTGNLIINCSKDYAWASEYGYGNDEFDDNGRYIPRKTGIDSHVFLDEFKAINPEPAQLLLEVDENTDPEDKMVKETPAYIVIKNNWCHFNKGIRDNPSRGVALYHVEEQVWRYSNASDFDCKVGQLYSDNANVSQYNSRRNDLDVTKLIKETAAGVIEITWEQFEKIGVDPAQWNLDVDLPEKTTFFPKG